MGRAERIVYGTATGAGLGIAVAVLHMCFARNWVKESVFSSFFFIMAGFGLGLTAGIGGGLIGLVLAWVCDVRWQGPVLGTIAGAAVGIVWNWIAFSGEWSCGPFLNDAAANRTLLFALSGTVIGSVVGGLWSSLWKAH